MTEVSLKANFKDAKFFEEFKKEFRQQVIETGLDKPINKSIKELKEELKYIVNEKIRNIHTSYITRTAIRTCDCKGV